jgi:hypothetical protein
MAGALRLYRGRQSIGRTWTQVRNREVNSILSFETTAPFDNWDIGKDFRKLPLDEQLGKLKSDAALKHKLTDIADRPYDGRRSSVRKRARPSGTCSIAWTRAAYRIRASPKLARSGASPRRGL